MISAHEQNKIGWPGPSMYEWNGIPRSGPSIHTCMNGMELNNQGPVYIPVWMEWNWVIRAQHTYLYEWNGIACSGPSIHTCMDGMEFGDQGPAYIPIWMEWNWVIRAQPVHLYEWNGILGSSIHAYVNGMEVDDLGSAYMHEWLKWNWNWMHVQLSSLPLIELHCEENPLLQHLPVHSLQEEEVLSLIHIWRCRRR